MAGRPDTGAPPAPRLRAVLFDAVGTLIHLCEPVGETYARLAGAEDRAAALGAAFARCLRAARPMAFPGQAPAAVRVAERAWWQAVVSAAFSQAGIALSEAAFARLWSHYAAAEAWRVSAGAHAALAALRAAGLRTGMVSNFDHRLPALLAALSLSSLLDVVVLPADAGAAKPDRRIFACALARLGVAPAEAVYVGDDTRDDLAGATAAGMRFIDVAGVGDFTSLVAGLTQRERSGLVPS